MCDIGTLEAVLGTAAGFITAALALIAVATALNGGFFSAPSAPAPMAAAGATTLAAVASLVAARALVENYFQCRGAPPECLGDYSNLISTFDGLITTLSIQAAATIALAAVAWVPWAIIPAQVAIVASLIAQLALIPTIIVFWSNLKSCIEAAAAASAVGPLIGTTFIFILIGVVYFYYAGRSNKKTNVGR